MLIKVDRSDNFAPVEDAEVYLITVTGEARSLGMTGPDGAIEIDKSVLRSSRVILFCHRWFFCGALYEWADTLEKLDYLLIDLAPFRVP